ncbi:hypothetical protein [Sphingomonas glaciei]|uniref:Uncharacterized protein n=1 Tax=Sphingomonas glaciei TaxID=2938948 RepID=A0ABY5MU11_9SPHN|nr:hypothetical protein [Sphingomonas glaciei]UUR07454.1 hypothetical protein M1K48_10965 [Sphingomonas glaciei]
MSSLGPEWLAHRYDPTHDAVHFRSIDRATRARVPFLIDDELGGPGQPRVVARSDTAGLQSFGGRLNFIFHSAYCCSTLLANAYNRPGSSFSLKEPTILNDLVGWRLRGAEPAQLAEVLGQALALLARPWRAGEVGVIKPSNVVNGLAPAMLGARPDARAVLLYAPLEHFIGSIANKGLWGRRWVRDLLAKQLRENLILPGFTAEEYFLLTDLQAAAAGWLAQHRLYDQIAQRFGDRVRTLNSETLLADPRRALEAIDGLFDVAGSDAEREGVIAAVFSRNAKSGEQFDAGSRKTNQASAASVHRDEIALVHEWAMAVAKSADIAVTPANPLLD